MDIKFIFVTMFLLYFHWVGDFLFQTRRMAETKSTSWLSLSLHCLLYSAIMIIGLIFTHFFFVDSLSFLMTAGFFGWIFVFHFITDAITSRLTTKYYKYGHTKKFWTTIGFDQWLHAGQILLIYWLVVR